MTHVFQIADSPLVFAHIEDDHGTPWLQSSGHLVQDGDRIHDVVKNQSEDGDIEFGIFNRKAFEFAEPEIH
jgi:hypothetical protein